ILKPTPAPSLRPTAAPRPSHRATGLDLSALDSSSEEQLLLRALLATDEQLTLQRVLDLTADLPGVAACALVVGPECFSSSSGKSGEAKTFRHQARELSRSLRDLAPLIGISDAETFTLNSESRLITFCFPGETTFGVLHDREPTLGLRDKLTLIARQLEKMHTA
ncbi:MAG: hypothetical protein KDK99_17165, partial [Verrucomicrobiales bacterium]|nr:hypothetical protein [Verrucomicrobiales bacterium]